VYDLISATPDKISPNSITGITCTTCAAIIQKGLTEMLGVEKVMKYGIKFEAILRVSRLIGRILQEGGSNEPLDVQ
jgi:copper chaperone CopZ